MILNDGAWEYVIRLMNEDADVLVDLFEQTETIYFDLERWLRNKMRQLALPLP